MKEYKAFLLIPVTILFLIGALQADGSKVFDPTTLGLVEELKEKSELPFLTPRQHTILWDTTHGVHLLYTPNGRYSNLAAMLVDSGFTIVMDGQGVNNIDLSPYDIIVINIASNWNSAYTGAEINALLSWYDGGHQQVLHTSDANWCDNSYMHIADDSVFSCNVFEYLSTPGGILIMSENTACPNANVAPVVQAFNMNCGLSYLSPVDLYFSNFAAHPIYSGVSQVYYRAAGELSASAPAQEIGWTSLNEGTIAEMNEAIGIELVSFLPFVVKDAIRLEWRTEYELGNAAWRLQRRGVQGPWKTIANIPAEGNSPHGQKYECVDSGVDYEKINFYRLGSIAFNGNVYWHSTIRSDPVLLGTTRNEWDFLILPNPVVEDAKLSFTLTNESIVSVSVYDVSGRLTKEITGRRLARGHHRIDLKVDDLHTGIYFCTITSLSGSCTTKFAVLRN